MTDYGNRKIWFRLLMLVFVFGAPIAKETAPQAEAADSREYQVKAVFLYNFSKFVTWPNEAFINADDDVVIGILGDDPFGKHLDDAVRGETINGRKLVVRRFKTVEDAAQSNILFVCSSEKARFASILKSLKEKAVLTVGEAGVFIKQGGMISFVLEDERVRYDVNPAAAEGVKLQISSKLLKLARTVVTGE